MIATLILLVSCGKKKELTKLEVKQRDTESLIQRMVENEFDYDWLLAKASCSAEVQGKKQNFKILLRARRDSALLMSLTYANIEGLKILLTKDSVKFINRQNSTYFLGDHEYVKKNFNVPADFQTLENLILGNFAIPYQADEKTISWIDSAEYLISNVKGRKLRKSMQKEQKKERLTRREEHVLQYWLSPENFKITRMAYSQLHEARTLFAEYSDFELMENQLMPQKCSFTLQNSGEETNLKIRFTKVRLNRPQNIDFTIPQKYEQVY